ncbi:hypothetical protein IJH89_00200 [Candidatus Saccharibacteria bacterium]|nr:hypothetical protein [Candidatus Saccharibacteria bacterium]
MSNDELQKAIDDITRDNAAPVAPEAGAVANEALANEIAGAPSKGEGLALNPLGEMPAAPAPAVPETPGMPPAGEASGEQEVSEGVGQEVENAIKDMGADEASAVEVSNTSRDGGIAPVQAFSDEQAAEIKIGTSAPAEQANSSMKSEDLGRIEKEAIKELYPLLAYVDLPAEGKFEICMKVAEEDSRALGNALEAAKRIRDEKKKAEALLKIVELAK